MLFLLPLILQEKTNVQGILSLPWLPDRILRFPLLSAHRNRILSYLPPALCVHIEPMAEMYDTSNLLDYLAYRFHIKRNYPIGFLPLLHQLEKEEKIRIPQQAMLRRIRRQRKRKSKKRVMPKRSHRRRTSRFGLQKRRKNTMIKRTSLYLKRCSRRKMVLMTNIRKSFSFL